MAVRRLHPEQPESFAFTAENLAWSDVLIARYPAGREASAVIPLLWRGQEQEGWVSEPMIRRVADMLGMPYIRVLEIATFYTMFLLQPVGARAHVQVCGTTPCVLRGAKDLLHVCKTRIAEHPFEISADGAFSWEEVECLGACVNAPMVQVVKDTYEDLTVDSFNALLDTFARGELPKPGPQTDRFFAEAEGGPTTLTDAGLYDGSINAEHRRRRIAVEEEKAQAAAAAAAAEAAKAPAPAAAAPTGAGSAKADAPVANNQEKAKPRESGAGETAAARSNGPSAGDKPQPAPANLAGEPASKPKAESLRPNVEGDDKAAQATARADAVGTRPAGIAAPRGRPDDLLVIKGIGPVILRQLHELGVYHFDQIAAWTPAEVAWVGTRLSFPGRIDREGWVAQAAELARTVKAES
jgi:NADH-quinone oxidoreductase subunit E